MHTSVLRVTLKEENNGDNDVFCVKLTNKLFYFFLFMFSHFQIYIPSLTSPSSSIQCSEVYKWCQLYFSVMNSVNTLYLILFKDTIVLFQTDLKIFLLIFIDKFYSKSYSIRRISRSEESAKRIHNEFIVRIILMDRNIY